MVQLQGDGSETRAFCHVDDVVKGIVTMWRKGVHMNVYHIGSMEEVSIAALAAEIARAMGADIRFIAGEAPAGATPRRCPDIARMRALGYAPAVALSEGIARTVAWYRANPQPAGGNELL